MNCYEITDEMNYLFQQATGEIFYLVWTEEGRKKITEDDWDDFVNRAVNSEEYLDKVEDCMSSVFGCATPAGMVGLINYINDYYIKNYGEDQAVKVWKKKGAGSLYCHTAYVFAKEFEWTDMKWLIRKWDADYGIDWECNNPECGNAGSYKDDHIEIDGENEFYCCKECLPAHIDISADNVWGCGKAGGSCDLSGYKNDTEDEDEEEDEDYTPPILEKEEDEDKYGNGDITEA